MAERRVVHAAELDAAEPAAAARELFALRLSAERTGGGGPREPGGSPGAAGRRP